MATAKKAVAKKAPASKRARVLSSAPEDDTPVRGAKKSSRVAIDDDAPEGEFGNAASSYFANMEKEGIEFVSAGAAVIDCMLGGGWANGRVANIVGDKSAGKTLLAIEACANFHMKFPESPIRYAETEHAFDEAYAEALGMPVDAIEFAYKAPRKKKAKKGETPALSRAEKLRAEAEAEAAEAAAPGEEGKKAPLRTVEDWYEDMSDFLARCKKNKGKRGLYVLDSLDALSDDAEMERDIDDASYGGTKPKKMGELFRRLIAEMDEANVLLLVISQLKDKIGVMFGEKQTRSGGRALDYYSSHIVWLAEIGKIYKTIGGIKRAIGVNVKARVKKNKVGLPFRDCEYPILFGYGVDDLTANVEWLLTLKHGEKLLRDELDMSKSGYDVRINKLRDRGGQEVRDMRAKLRALVIQEWQKVETSFLPKARKY